MPATMQKRMTGVYVFEHRSTCVTLIRQADDKWTATYRCPFASYGHIVKVVRHTRSLAAADAVAHLNDDAEVFGR